MVRVDRLLGEHGIQEDSAKGRAHFQARMEERRREGVRRGWRPGAVKFAGCLAGRSRGQEHELARAREATEEQLRQRLARE